MSKGTIYSQVLLLYIQRLGVILTYFKTQFQLKHKPNQIHKNVYNNIGEENGKNLYYDGLTCEL